MPTRDEHWSGARARRAFAATLGTVGLSTQARTGGWAREMNGDRAFEDREGEPADETGPSAPVDARTMLGAVRDDIRQTLRVPWIDPALEAASASPVFFIAAWSAIRPNVGKSFLLLARTLRTRAAETVRGLDLGDLRKQIERLLPEDDVRRAEDIARAAHVATAKAQIVTHELARAAARDPIRGTGREEPPIRRGIPEWQRWIAHQPVAGASPLPSDAAAALHLAAVPILFRQLSRWPDILEPLAERLVPVTRSDEWRLGAARLRRIVRSGVETLPHPISLQWSALIDRGVDDDERRRLAAVLEDHDRSMPEQTLLAAFVWAGMGSPDIGAEG